MEKRIVYVLGLFLMLASSALATPYFVDGDAGSDANSGLSWAAAVKTVGQGLTLAAASGDVVNIKAVANPAGPNRYVAPAGGWAPTSGVTLQGVNNPILTGDINGDDVDVDLMADPCGMYKVTIAPGVRSDNTLILNLAAKTGMVINDLTLKGGYKTAAGNGGAADCSGASSVTFNNCLFTQNVSGGSGSCIFATTGTINANNCQFIQNSAYSTGGAINLNGTGGVLNLTNSILSVIWTLNDAGAVYLRGQPNITISDCVFDRCRMTNNAGGAGCIMTRVTSVWPTATIKNCIFDQCNGTHHGCAFYLQTRGSTLNKATANLDNILVTRCSNYWPGGGNVAVHAEYSAGADGSFATINLTNSTITNNNDTTGNGSSVGSNCAATGDSATMNVKNCIVWGNYGTGSSHAQLGKPAAQTTSFINVDYSCIDNSDPNDYLYSLTAAQNSTQHNLVTRLDGAPVGSPPNPQFDAGYFLGATSSCINAGNNASEALPTDLSGRPRIHNTTIDMGAYEYYLPGDVNGLNGVNLVDFEALAATWLDSDCGILNKWCGNTDGSHNGTVDMTDFNNMATGWLQ
jgi:hypothetical protein